jgi:hypothetical protein
MPRPKMVASQETILKSAETLGRIRCELAALFQAMQNECGKARARKYRDLAVQANEVYWQLENIGMTVDTFDKISKIRESYRRENPNAFVCI